MKKSLEIKLLDYPRPFITITELEILLGGTPDSLHSKVKRLLKSEKLIRLSRGIYLLTEKIGYRKKIHSFEIASFLYGQSCISLESALSYYNLIPEAVYTTTCITTKRSKNINTPIGNFSYTHMPLKNFYTQVKLIKFNDFQFLIASPWRAICDYVYAYKKDWQSLYELENSLRIEIEDLPKIPKQEIQDLKNYYKNKRIDKFLEGISNECRNN